jgi:hypothetical protein
VRVWQVALVLALHEPAPELPAPLEAPLELAPELLPEPPEGAATADSPTSAENDSVAPLASAIPCPSM